MKPFIEVAQDAGPICVTLPPRRIAGIYEPTSVTLRVHREGVRHTVAEYPSAFGESGKLCFQIDDDLVNSKPGWYIGIIYECRKPVHTIRINIPRPRFSDATTLRMKCG